MRHWLTARLGFDPTPPALLDWQMAQIRAMVRHAAAHSHFYRHTLAGIDSHRIRVPADMATLPRTSQEALRAAPDDFLCGSRDDVARVVTLNTSGTTGSPKRVFNAIDDLEFTTDFFSQGMRQMTEPGENVLILLPGATPGGVGALLTEAVGRFGACGIVHGPLDDRPATLAALEILGRPDVTCVVGAPAHLNILAASWEAEGLPTCALRTALICWDAVPEAVCRNLRRALGCAVFSHWGMVETGLGGAVDCPLHQGMHLREADIYVEVADPETGMPLPDGTTGELLVTTLSRQTMPLIRYRTGDLGRIIPGPCDCGHPARRLDRISGRLDPAPVDLNGLNEIVYAMDGVTDFAATLTQGAQPMLRLRIHHTTLNTDTPQAVEERVAEAITGHCDIAVDLVPDSGPALPGLAKRKVSRV
jgi:phenylacetate-coenzyme A ligase PaaK-like adenylate-forming protein